MTRLPTPGQDSGTWGGILNDFLSTAHNSDGSLKPGAISVPDGSISTAKLIDNAVTNTKLDAATQTTLATVASKYTKPAGGVPATDLSAGVQTALSNADSALQVAPVTSVNTQTGAVSLAKADVGLANADNTSDANKPVSTAQAIALSGKVDTTDSRLTDARTPTAHTQTASTISDSTATGRSVVTAADAAAARMAIGAGTSSLALGSTAGTALDAASASATYAAQEHAVVGGGTVRRAGLDATGYGKDADLSVNGFISAGGGTGTGTDHRIWTNQTWANVLSIRNEHLDSDSAIRFLDAATGLEKGAIGFHNVSGADNGSAFYGATFFECSNFIHLDATMTQEDPPPPLRLITTGYFGATIGFANVCRLSAESNGDTNLYYPGPTFGAQEVAVKVRGDGSGVEIPRLINSGLALPAPAGSVVSGTPVTENYAWIADAVLGTYTFTALAGRRYEAKVSNLLAFSTVAGDHAIFAICSGGAGVGFIASQTVIPGTDTSLNGIGLSLAGEFVPGAGSVTLSLCAIRISGTGSISARSVPGCAPRELYVVDIGPA